MACMAEHASRPVRAKVQRNAKVGALEAALDDACRITRLVSGPFLLQTPYGTGVVDTQCDSVTYW